MHDEDSHIIKKPKAIHGTLLSKPYVTKKYGNGKRINISISTETDNGTRSYLLEAPLHHNVGEYNHLEKDDNVSCIYVPTIVEYETTSNEKITKGIYLLIELKSNKEVIVV